MRRLKLVVKAPTLVRGNTKMEGKMMYYGIRELTGKKTHAYGINDKGWVVGGHVWEVLGRKGGG